MIMKYTKLLFIAFLGFALVGCNITSDNKNARIETSVKNVKITNIHDKYAKIYKDEKWLIKHRKDVIEDLVENGYADFEEFKDLNDDELTEKIKERYTLMKENYENHFEGVCQNSEIAVINGTNSGNYLNV